MNYYKNLASHIALLAALLPASQQLQAADADSPPQTFDQFIDTAPGKELQHQETVPKDVYRAKRINKTLFTFIDSQGYYIIFSKNFKTWCDSNAGSYKGAADNMNGVCLDQNEHGKALGAYEAVLQASTTYGGQMTSGFVTFYYFNQDGYARRSGERNLAALTRDEIALKNQQCLQELTRNIQEHPQLGMETNFGMIVDVKPPLVLIQNTAYSPPTQWVKLSQLLPAPRPYYCTGTVLPGANQ